MTQDAILVQLDKPMNLVTHTEVYVKTSRATVLQVESTDKAIKFIERQRMNHGDKCPDYRLAVRTIITIEEEINV